MSENIIEMTDVCKSFDGKIVHRGINLSVRSGEIITVLGESGVGKSVLLKEINGLVKPDRWKGRGSGRGYGADGREATCENKKGNGHAVSGLRPF